VKLCRPSDYPVPDLVVKIEDFRVSIETGIDLPGFGHDESRVMHRQLFAALVVPFKH
jgi:hypothetical protein